jgi:hypothetical protein
MGAQLSFFRAVGIACVVAVATIAAACSSDPEPGCVNRDGSCWCGDMLESADSVSECSAATMGGPVACCDDGRRCECGLYACNFAAAPCVCTDVGDPHPAASTCSGTRCCADDPGLCTCGTENLPCARGSVEVASCSAASSLCRSGERRVDKCLPR